MSGQKPLTKFLSFVWEITKIVVVAALIVIPIRYFLFQPFLVRGQSMEPNFENGDYLIVDEISYRFRNPRRGEVIVFKYPNNPSQRFIKRIIGLPGETIEIKNGKITIQKGESFQVLNELDYLPLLETTGNIKVELGENEYFGDNRLYSFDSRRFGPLSEGKIIGKVFLRAWPFVNLKKFGAPTY